MFFAGSKLIPGIQISSRLTASRLSIESGLMKSWSADDISASVLDSINNKTGFSDLLPIKSQRGGRKQFLSNLRSGLLGCLDTRDWGDWYLPRSWHVQFFLRWCTCAADIWKYLVHLVPGSTPLLLCSFGFPVQSYQFFGCAVMYLFVQDLISKYWGTLVVRHWTAHLCF